MPEQLTKYPEVTIEVLRSAGVQCGVGAKQEILTACPTARFCKVPGGELCIYGLPDALKMTQISRAEWQAVIAKPPAPQTPSAPPRSSGESVLDGGLGILAGLAVGVAATRLAQRRR